MKGMSPASCFEDGFRSLTGGSRERLSTPAARERSEAPGARSEASGPYRCAQVIYPRNHFHPCTGFGLDQSRSAQLSIRAPAAVDGVT